ncbi:MAG: 16S rRNA (cytidine(1402)-2'-O)-methyltransferase [Lachnospiraceae bacterium]|nr:16S rRNA (cytidine(1402)-2'-O)-methyltransferase [Lachnospiraceae bacterium]
MPECGILYLVATPIGNLKDMTERARETLGSVDLIAAEDTRNSLKLLNHFGIKTPMTSYHEHNKYDKAEYLISELKNGKNIALITDAGTPGISDPGEVMVSECRKNGITVTSLPGCCALINALIISGLPTARFCFEAFLPSDKKERDQILEELKTETRTIIIYEAPHRLVKTLEELQNTLGDREISLCRELTKKFEEVKTMSLPESVLYYRKNEPKGEFVLVIRGEKRSKLVLQDQKEWADISIEAHMEMYLKDGLEKKEAMKKVAKDRGITRRDVYQALLEK